MWLSVKNSPVVRKPLRFVRRLKRDYFNRYVGPHWFRYRTATGPRRIVIGSSGLHDRGWIPSDIEYLDLLKPETWARYFEPGAIRCLLAEHVWEHLSEADGLKAARTCFTYLQPGGYLRLAVPDGFHPSSEYQSWVKVGGASPGQITNNHLVLYNYHTITDLLERAGFRVELYEFYDEQGEFHYRPWSREQGTIRRTLHLDPRNRGGKPVFTSIMLDAFKPVETGSVLEPLQTTAAHSPVSRSR